MILLFVCYVLATVSGWYAVIHYFIEPSWWTDDYAGVAIRDRGFDLNIVEVIVILIVGAVPIFGTVPFNLFWFALWWRRWRKGRPLPAVLKGRS